MLWFIVNTDLTITTKKLVKKFATLEVYYVDSALLGFVKALDDHLDLPLSKVAEIKRNYHSPSQRREAYLDLYATDHPCPSWSRVAEVLRYVDLDHQADVVKSTYVQGTIITLIHPFCVHYYHRMC